MGAGFNIGSLLNEAFGLNGVVASSGYKGITIAKDDTNVYRQSYLGTPIIFPIIFKGQKYQVYNDIGELDTVQLSDFELPAVSISTFSRKKNISETKMTASYGTVKEMYGFDDWQIQIRGLCLKDPSHSTAKTAFEQHLKLLAFDRVAEAIPVEGELFNDKGIDAIVIKSITFYQLPGKPTVMPFTLNCVSDTPTELIL